MAGAFRGSRRTRTRERARRAVGERVDLALDRRGVAVRHAPALVLELGECGGVLVEALGDLDRVERLQDVAGRRRLRFEAEETRRLRRRRLDLGGLALVRARRPRRIERGIDVRREPVDGRLDGTRVTAGDAVALRLELV